MVIECAFGRLKGRWRALMKRNDCHTSIMPNVVMASAILHNICELRGENIPNFDDPDNINEAEGPDYVENRRDDNGNPIRQALCMYFDENRI
jgi:hypothetical protein